MRARVLDDGPVGHSQTGPFLSRRDRHTPICRAPRLQDMANQEHVPIKLGYGGQRF